MTTEQTNTTKAEVGLKNSLVASLARRVVRYTCCPSPYYISPRTLLLHDFTRQNHRNTECLASILMTVVAPSRRIVPACGRWRANVRMRHSRPVRVWRRMAILTRERLIVRRNQVAVRTDRAIMRNAEPAVIKGRPEPGGGGPRAVAGHASRRGQ